MEIDDIEEIRNKLINYYGTALPFNEIAQTELIKIESLSDDDILKEARKLGIIK
ncbi:MAG: hypothetical protein R3Y13_05670 [bacterium]